MNSDGRRCYDNARCESMWARMKEEVFYNRNRKSQNYTISELKSMIRRYFMSYWNNRRICSDSGLPPAEKRRRYYQSLSILCNVCMFNKFDESDRHSSISELIKYLHSPRVKFVKYY